MSVNQEIIQDSVSSIDWTIGQVTKQLDAIFLGYDFERMSDKSIAWNKLLQLINDDDLYIKTSSIRSLGFAFSSIPDMYIPDAWSALHKLTFNNNWFVKASAVEALGHAFPSIPNIYISTAWDDFHRLASGDEAFIRYCAAEVIGNVISSFSDTRKYDAYELLTCLINDSDFEIKGNAIKSLGDVFSSIPKQYQHNAQSFLFNLINNADSEVRGTAANGLGSAFSSLSDEYQSNAWTNLIKLASDEKPDVRMNANYALGKVCIYKASQSDNKDSRGLLGKAIQYFEKSANESRDSNSARFCSLFYRSFDAVIFNKIASKEEINDYIVAAKREILYSKSKKKLIEAVEQLAEVLETVQSARESGINEQELLKHCSDICNHVDHLMDLNKEKTPAIYELYKKSRPNFDAHIKELIEDLKEIAEAACKEGKGTRYENLACNIREEIAGWGGINDEIISMQIERFIKIVNKYMPPQEAESVCNELEDIKTEKNVTKLISTIVDDIISILLNVKTSEEFALLKKELAEIKKMLEPSMSQEFVVTSGFSVMGTGGQLVTSYPVKNIPKSDVKKTVSSFLDKGLKNDKGKKQDSENNSE
jgi:HEAT repeat protein